MAQGGAPRPSNPNTISTGRLAGLIAQAPGPKQKPRRGGAKLVMSCHTELADLSGGQQTHHPNAETHCWLRAAPHEKAPPGSGAKLLLAYFQKGTCRLAEPAPEESIAMGL